MKKKKLIFGLLFFIVHSATAIDWVSYVPELKGGGEINAHGGQIISYNGLYYWIGENEAVGASDRHGFNIYTSKDFNSWEFCGNVLNVYNNESLYDGVSKGDIFERPRIIIDNKNRRFLIWFHYERKGRGYSTAEVGVAASPDICRNYKIVNIRRLNANTYPISFHNDDLTKGKYFARDFSRGQMSRDINIYQENGQGYLISSSENNSTLTITKLNDSFDGLSNQFVRVNPGVWSEAPILIKISGSYYIVASGTTGWRPNKAQAYKASNIMGEWKRLDNPVTDERYKNNTFNSQGTSIFKYGGGYIFLSDMWDPRDLSKSKYVWSKVNVNDGKIYLTR